MHYKGHIIVPCATGYKIHGVNRVFTLLRDAVSHINDPPIK